MKEHRCDGMPRKAKVEKMGDATWYLHYPYEDFTPVITHCPWCGVKLEDSE